MTTQTKHTPNWHVNGTHIFAQDNPGGRKMAIAEVFRDAGADHALTYAKLIVRACNSHYQLVEACKAACLAASDCLPPSGEGELDIGYYKAKLLAIDGAASKCSAALALAEKGME